MKTKVNGNRMSHKGVIATPREMRLTSDTDPSRRDQFWGLRWGAAELRQMATRLTELADAIDLKTAVELGTFSAAKAEREELLIRVWAESEYTSRRQRSKFIDGALLGEPAWDMLLDLFVQNAHRRRVSVTSVCKASGVADTTALRWLTMLEKNKLVQRVPALRDRRVQFVELTDDGLLAMSKWLRYRAALSI
jgi:DNA-binding MarR family transcriptional regulator